MVTRGCICEGGSDANCVSLCDQIGDERAVDALGLLVGDSDEGVQNAALRALTLLEPPSLQSPVA